MAKSSKKTSPKKPTWGKSLTATQRFVISRGGSAKKTTKKGGKK